MIIGMLDKSPLMILGVRAAFDPIEGATVIAVSNDGAGAEDVDVLLLDARMAGGEPDLGVLHMLAAKTSVLLVTRDRPADGSERYLRAGAKGCIQQQASPQEMIDAVLSVASGLPVDQNDRSAGIDALSPREHRALTYIARGFTHEQTARRMRISKHTVDTYVKRARAKLKLGNKAELTRAILYGTVSS